MISDLLSSTSVFFFNNNLQQQNRNTTNNSSAFSAVVVFVYRCCVSVFIECGLACIPPVSRRKLRCCHHGRETGVAILASIALKWCVVGELRRRGQLCFDVHMRFVELLSCIRY